jgi:hypothetical protein
MSNQWLFRGMCLKIAHDCAGASEILTEYQRFVPEAQARSTWASIAFDKLGNLTLLDVPSVMTRATHGRSFNCCWAVERAD